MASSWSGMRKILEQENICDSLRGRIQYFVTRYRGSHDAVSRVAIRVDGGEIIRSNYYDWDAKRRQAWAGMPEERPWRNDEARVRGEREAVDRGGFDRDVFYAAFAFYRDHSITECLQSPDAVVRLFAILDRRVGKRRLATIARQIGDQPQWLQFFYRLRLDGEGIPTDVEMPVP